MSTQLEVKADRLEKMMLEMMDMIGRLDTKIEAVEARLGAGIEVLAEDVRQLRTEQAHNYKETVIRFLTCEEDMRRLKMDYRMLDERVRLLEGRNDAHSSKQE
ncbi:MAG TPA: hypothetical protein VNQ79_04575 [Blastocatellia bacterium]|nr:hypothetical protein [Blastocatellia bacterium]